MKKLIQPIINRAPKRVLIYFLGVYVLFQFTWWAYMLVSINTDIYGLKLEMLYMTEMAAPELQILKAELDQKLTIRIWMVLGEGAVFIFILLLGFRSVKKSIAKELMLAEQQKNFLLSVTHELKSPLAAIKLQLQTLRSRELPPEKRAQLYNRALIDTDRLEKLVENLLLVNKVESNRMPIAQAKFNLTVLINQFIANSYANELESGKLKLSLTENIMVLGDELAMQSIVSNLIDNAFKYAPNSDVNVSLRCADKIILSVSDSGPGIPEGDKEKIFERFFRLGSEETRKTKGTGIGLYIVKLLVELHGGQIKVENNKPKGAQFVINLPVI